MNGHIVKVFPGGNTSEGFYSWYQYLLEKGTKRIFVIKGGPGVGKSTLMKKIGHKMVDLGYDVEFHYCSSDNNSLDGIAVSEAGIVMVDGTAPHIVDPKYPGGIDEIVNMGEYWDKKAMMINRDKIIASTKEVSRLFARGYGFFRSAAAISNNLSVLYQNGMNYTAVNKIAAVFQSMFDDISYTGKAGGERHLFSCAYTPEGFIDYTDSILQDIKEVYYLEGALGTGKSTLMNKIALRAVEKGLHVEIFHTPLIPSKTGTIVVRELSLALTSSDKFKMNNQEHIDMNQFLDKKRMQPFQKEIENDSELLEKLTSLGIENIRLAKAEHDILEQYYVPHMDFAAADKKAQEITDRILFLAEDEAMAATGKFH